MYIWQLCGHELRDLLYVERKKIGQCYVHIEYWVHISAIFCCTFAGRFKELLNQMISPAPAGGPIHTS